MNFLFTQLSATPVTITPGRSHQCRGLRGRTLLRGLFLGSVIQSAAVASSLDENKADCTVASPVVTSLSVPNPSVTNPSTQKPSSFTPSPCKRVIADADIDLFTLASTQPGNIREYLNQGHNPNLVDHEQKQSILQIFSYSGNETMVALLMEKGASLTYADDRGHNALYMASSQGNTAIINLLIHHVKTTSDADTLTSMINHADTRGITPLHIACVKGYDSIVESLLRNRAIVDQVDAEGRTALHFSCYGGYEPIIRRLLDYRADVTKANRDGLRAIDFFKLGELKEDVRRSHAIEDLLGYEHKMEMIQDDRNAQKRLALRTDERLKEFMETFQRKSESVFLAYRTLESGAIQGTKDSLCASTVINLLGSNIPLPGASLVSKIVAGAVGVIEANRELDKKKRITEFFTTISDMERAVEQGAYELTCAYEGSIRQLTVDGAKTLANCGVVRFVEYMRDSPTVLEKGRDLSGYVLESVRRVEANVILDQLLFWKNKTKIETTNGCVWTDRDIFQDHRGSDLGIANLLNPVYASVQVPIHVPLYAPVQVSVQASVQVPVQVPVYALEIDMDPKYNQQQSPQQCNNQNHMAPEEINKTVNSNPGDKPRPKPSSGHWLFGCMCGAGANNTD